MNPSSKLILKALESFECDRKAVESTLREILYKSYEKAR